MQKSEQLQDTIDKLNRAARHLYDQKGANGLTIPHARHAYRLIRYAQNMLDAELKMATYIEIVLTRPQEPKAECACKGILDHPDATHHPEGCRHWTKRTTRNVYPSKGYAGKGVAHPESDVIPGVSYCP